MAYYVRVLNVCMTLECAYISMLSGWGPMVILYAIPWYTCMSICWAGPVILSGWGPFSELVRDPLYLVGVARYTHRQGPLYV